MWQYIVTFIGSLVVALISVWISQRWSAKSRDKRTLASLKSEISINITICGLTCQHLDEELQLTDEHRMGVRPFAELFTWSWNIAKSTIVLSESDAFEDIEAAYYAVDIVNKYIRRIEELKHGIPVMFKGAREIRKMNYAELKRYIQEYAMPGLRDAKQIIEKELSQYRWWRF